MEKKSKKIGSQNASWAFQNSQNNINSYNFDKRDLNHLVNLYKKYSILPESLTRVKCDFLIQKTQLIRFVIKQLDIILQVGGLFELDLIESKFHSGPFLSTDQVMYEFSISTFGRYSLIEKTSKGGIVNYRFKKNKKSLNRKDIITKWTFGIPSGGKKIDGLMI